MPGPLQAQRLGLARRVEDDQVGRAADGTSSTVSSRTRRIVDVGENGGLRVRLLGTFEVRRGDTPVPVPGARLRGLVARLALAGGRPVDPVTLADALWPEERPADPVNALQSLVSRLRRILGGGVEGGYRLDVADDDVDALRFERLAAAGQPEPPAQISPAQISPAQISPAQTPPAQARRA